MLYSVIIPVYNSKHTLMEVVDRVYQVFENLQKKVEVILIEDGSMDKSWQQINLLKNKYNVRLKAIPGRNSKTDTNHRNQKGRFSIWSLHTETTPLF